MNIQDCIAEGSLQKIPVDKRLIEKELAEADYDLEKASHAFDEKDYKWCIVKSYYAMFHAARAVLFSLGLRERKHFAIEVVLEDLNKKGKLESKFLADFSFAMSAREDADYHYTHSEETAKAILDVAEGFVEKIEGLKLS